MPQYQLEVAVFLTCCALLSCVFVYRAARTEDTDASIALPIYNGSLDDSKDALEDPFNVTTAEDMVDGQPIREEEFWRKVCGAYYLCSSLCSLAADARAEASARDDIYIARGCTNCRARVDNCRRSGREGDCGGRAVSRRGGLRARA